MMQNHESLYCFTPLLTFDTDYRRIRHSRMFAQCVFDLFGEDADAAAFDHVLFAAGNMQVALLSRKPMSPVWHQPPWRIPRSLAGFDSRLGSRAECARRLRLRCRAELRGRRHRRYARARTRWVCRRCRRGVPIVSTDCCDLPAVGGGVGFEEIGAQSLPGARGRAPSTDVHR